MLSMATFLPQILKYFYVFKALKCASYVSSKTHYFQTVSILSEFTFHDNIRIVCVINTSISLQGKSTIQETHCSGKRAAFRWGDQVQQATVQTELGRKQTPTVPSIFVPLAVLSI